MKHETPTLQARLDDYVAALFEYGVQTEAQITDELRAELRYIAVRSKWETNDRRRT